jgi:hypothetical protein
MVLQYESEVGHGRRRSMVVMADRLEEQLGIDRDDAMQRALQELEPSWDDQGRRDARRTGRRAAGLWDD